jgi:hypothetical protein
MASTEPSPSGLVVIDLHSASPDRSFAGWMLRQREGALHTQLTDALSALALAVCDTCKPGELVLKIRLTPHPEEAELLIVKDELTTKPPRPDTKPDVFRFDEVDLALAPLRLEPLAQSDLQRHSQAAA